MTMVRVTSSNGPVRMSTLEGVGVIAIACSSRVWKRLLGGVSRSTQRA